MIYIDASRYSLTEQKTGVENYSVHLINELIRLAPNEITLIAPTKIDLPVPQITIPFPRLWTQVRLSFEIWKNKKIDNLFVPSHVMPWISPKNTVTTIHDVAFRRLPSSYSLASRLYLDWGAKYAVKHARHIIVPSEATKKDLIDFYKADPQKITVIPLGFEPINLQIQADESERILGRYALRPTNYFLFVGRIESKKNIQTLIDAYNLLSSKSINAQLVLAGKPGVGSDEIFSKLGNPNIVVTGYVDDKTKQALMQNALAFVYPSLFEGFGIPLLEAMAANLPIIASKIPSSWELAKDNALFFDPQNAEELAGLMEKVAKEEDFRRLMTQNHTKTLEQYSWKRCAEETLNLLHPPVELKAPNI